MSAGRYEVCLYVSQLAACLGLDKFKGVDDALEAVWKRLDPAGLASAYRRCGKTSHSDQVRAAISQDANIVGAVNTFASSVSGADSDDTQRMANGLAKEYGDKYGGDTRQIQQEIRSSIYTTYGTAFEHKVFTALNGRRTFGAEIVKDNRFHSLPMGVVDGVHWYIGGRIDAAFSDGSAIVEIKTRVYRLFRYIRPHDMMQVQAYMQLLGVDRGYLVECFHRHNDLDLCVLAAYRDDPTWESFVRPRLTAFVRVLFWLLRDPARQDALITSDRRAVLVSDWVRSAMTYYAPS